MARPKKSFMGEPLKMVRLGVSALDRLKKIAASRNMSFLGLVEYLSQIAESGDELNWDQAAAIFPDSRSQAVSRWKSLEDDVLEIIRFAQHGATRDDVCKIMTISDPQVDRILENLCATRQIVRIRGNKFKIPIRPGPLTGEAP
jgi:hypothetical protein